jgi:23S rRNA pseudouridine2457 synthase
MVAGRLDYRSEGLLILTNNSHLATSVTQTALPKRYWVLVEGKVTDDIITSLRSGLDIGNGEKTLPCVVNHLPGPPPLIDELFPIPQALVGRVYDGSNHSWLEFELREGKNRQIRRMVAKVGLGAIRIVRHAIGALSVRIFTTYDTQSLFRA